MEYTVSEKCDSELMCRLILENHLDWSRSGLVKFQLKICLVKSFEEQVDDLYKPQSEQAGSVELQGDER